MPKHLELFDTFPITFKVDSSKKEVMMKDSKKLRMDTV